MSNTMTAVALAVAYRVAEQEVRRLRRWNICSDTGEELKAECLLRACEAWNTFDPAKGDWQAHCRMYLRTYATRASNKAKSVVTTDYAARKMDRDEGMVLKGEEGEEVRDFEADSSGQDERVEARQSLRLVYAQFARLEASLSDVQAAIARDWMESGGEIKPGELAEAHNVSTTTVHRVLRALRETAIRAVA